MDGTPNLAATKKSLGYCLCSDVSDWDCFQPVCKTIDTNEDICIPIGQWQWANDVYVNVVRPDVWCCKTTKKCNIVSLCFILLAFQTSLCPFTNVTIDVGSNLM